MEALMDMKMIAGAARSGRRGALAGLLAGTAALLSRGGDTEARTRCRRAAICPRRLCCTCKDTAPNPGCQYAPYTQFNFPAACDKVCGAAGTTLGASLSPVGASIACDINGIDCIEIGCPR
jgi:hypothetical protein